MVSRPPLPAFTEETARQKIRLAEDGWNGRDPAKVSLLRQRKLGIFSFRADAKPVRLH